MKLLASIMFAVCIGVITVGAAAPASAQGYYDRLYRGASPDPSDARPEQMSRDEADRAARAARRRADEDPPPTTNTRRGFDDDRNGCDSRQSGRASGC